MTNARRSSNFRPWPLLVALFAAVAVLAAPRRAHATDNHEHLSIMFTLDHLQTQLTASGLGDWENLSLAKIMVVTDEFIDAALRDHRVADALRDLDEDRYGLVRRLAAAGFKVKRTRDGLASSHAGTHDLITVAGDASTYADIALEILTHPRWADVRVGRHLEVSKLTRLVGNDDGSAVPHVVRYQVGETLRTALMQDALARLDSPDARRRFIDELLSAFVARHRGTLDAGMTIVAPQSLLGPDVVAAIAAVVERERIPIHVLVSVPRNTLPDVTAVTARQISVVAARVDGLDITGSIQESSHDQTNDKTYATALTRLSDAMDQAVGDRNWVLRIHAFEATNDGPFYRGLETFLKGTGRGPASIVIGHNNALCATERGGRVASSVAVITALLAWRSAVAGRHVGFDVNLSSKFLARRPKHGRPLFESDQAWMRGLRINVASLNAVGIPVMAGYDGVGILDEGARGTLQDFVQRLSEGQADPPPAFADAFRCGDDLRAIKGRSPATYHARAFYEDVFASLEKRLFDVNRMTYPLRRLAHELDAASEANLTVLRQDRDRLQRAYDDQCTETSTAHSECKDLKRKLSQAGHDVDVARSTVADTQLELTRQTAASEAARYRLASCQDNLDEANEEIEDHCQTITKLDAEVTALTEELAETKAALRTCETENLRTCSERDDYARQLEEAKQLIATLRAALPVVPAASEPEPMDEAIDSTWDTADIYRWSVDRSAPSNGGGLLEIAVWDDLPAPAQDSRWSLTWSGGSATGTVTKVSASRFVIRILGGDLRGTLPGEGELVTAERPQ